MATLTLLETTGLSKHFEGLQAVQGVELTIPTGEIRAVIGPNGAGKTTLVSLVSGRLRPSEGTVRFKDEDISSLSAWDRVSRGIVYTFQVTSVYANLSCYENVALAVQRRMMGGLLDRLMLREARVTQGIELALSQVGLTEDTHRRAGDLPYGHQRLLEVAMGLALEPELLILDEPTQGLALDEISNFCELIRAISKRATVLLIEHNMSVVLELAQMITVMDKGMVIAEGPPDEIEQNEEVQRAYLGTNAAA
ncbi:MAG: ABC transporter ATP-binding protein [Alphaproteobacteria bacterium]|nr:ABC transporter ATP-binding protein [Alphaproteobacteria bacterium]|tara:strand:+ start:5404 stop:6159 length:756 start_codon:yes stop_codon:yes gene_type:complete